MMNRAFSMSILLLLTLVAQRSVADTMLTVSETKGGFALFDKSRVATIYVDAGEPVAVRKAVALFAEDVERVTGLKPVVTANAKAAQIIIGTLGHSPYVDRLVKGGRVDAGTISGGWEQFLIKTDGDQLFVVGSDRRGTAYGLFTLSEKMGVSPWYWWADVPVERRSSVYVTADYVSKTPSVKYRGIFINDEDWGLKPWATTNYEKELGDIGPRTYARVCELLLRLKANMLAPAMHSCTGAFYSHPDSKVVCDSFGIIVTTSHCEPLLLNNAAKSEWDQNRDGDWNYKTNRETIVKKWDDRLAEASQYENIYTVAMRGVHDAGLRGNLPMNERVPLIEQVIKDQRELLVKHKAYSPISSPSSSPDPRTIPQIFVPYKETMDIYENGLRVPDDITLVWVDDNYGYLKRVSNPEEQRRSGRAGVYYHLSYLGAPHDYLWLNTTPPVLMYEELKKAYDTGADRYWLLNVGDIKPMELGIQTFMDMAWDFGTFNISNTKCHQAEMLASLFGKEHEKEFQTILDDYYRLAWSRKPEFMGFEYEWDDKEHTGLKPTDFSFQNYGDAQQRLADYQRLSDAVELMATNIRGAGHVLYGNSSASDAFYELLQFPVQGACQMNRKFLMAQLNQELGAQGLFAEANWAARQMEQAYDSIDALNRRYNEQLNGKWRGMMALSTGFTNTTMYYKKPEVKRYDGINELPVDLTPKHETLQGCYVLDLSNYDNKSSDARLVSGIGYDWQVMQLGQATYSFPAVSRDTVEVTVYTVPFWPLYAGKSNVVSIAVDDGQPQVFENKFEEYSRTWKDQVMRNGAVCRLRFAVDKTKAAHTISFIAKDPGQMLQRVIVDWGGLKPTYVGPEMSPL
ncbi:MAG: glycosyl hydrolase 115 family protein [Prevotella sp.]|nr:glycosyl hydrolase 115 family protein [Prevotella sp.]